MSDARPVRPSTAAASHDGTDSSGVSVTGVTAALLFFFAFASGARPRLVCRRDRLFVTGPAHSHQQKNGDHRERTRGDAHSRRPRHADCGNQHEAGDECADCRARGVHRVERASGASDTLATRASPHVPAHGNRKRRAQRRRRHEHHDEARKEADGREEHPWRAIVIRRAQNRREHGQLERQQQCDDDHQGFEGDVGDEALPPGQAGGDPAANRGADGEAAHERRHHGARGRRRVPHVQRQQPRPAHLIDEAGQAGAGVCREKK